MSADSFSNISEESTPILGENGILLLRPTLDSTFPSRLSRLLNTIPLKFKSERFWLLRSIYLASLAASTVISTSKGVGPCSRQTALVCFGGF